MYKKILVPLDGSALAERVLPFLPPLLSDFDGTVILLRVIQPEITYTGVEQPALRIPTERVREEANEYLSRVRDRLFDRGIRAQMMVSEGDPASEITAVANLHGADLVAIATRAHTGFKRSLLGSVADGLLHTLSQPLFLVRGTTPLPELLPLRRILVPLDGSTQAEQSLPNAVGIAQAAHATLVLLRAVTSETRSDGNSDRTLLHRRNVRAATQYLNNIRALLDATDIASESHVVSQNTEPAILSAAEYPDIDMIVLATYGRVGMERWLHGSMTEKVLRGSNKPILVVNAATQPANPVAEMQEWAVRVKIPA